MKKTKQIKKGSLMPLAKALKAEFQTLNLVEKFLFSDVLADLMRILRPDIKKYKKEVFAFAEYVIKTEKK